MHTAIASSLQAVQEAHEAETLLRACVHCGFCLSTCPTYQITGDELDSPRGRIYQIKSLIEGEPPGTLTQYHLDRCLTCRACESTCPSGVRYGQLVDLGRTLLDQRHPRPLAARAVRYAVRTGLGQRALFGAALGLARSMRGLLPHSLAARIPVANPTGNWPAARHARRMIVLDGCVQPALDPGINAAAARVFDRLGISLVRVARAGCCGALPHHTGDHAGGLAAMRRNIDAWWPQVEAGVEAIVMTASGCGSEVREYGHHLRHDPAYAERAAAIAALTRDVSELLFAEREAIVDLISPTQRPVGAAATIAYHPPCSLQHGQRVRGKAEALLIACGFTLAPFAESHLCCGSAGSYSILQPEMSQTLKARKLGHLLGTAPSCIATANIGCQAHLQSGTPVPVRHWINLVEGVLREAAATTV